MSSHKYFDAVVAVTLILALGLTSVLLYFSKQNTAVEAMSSSVSMPYEEIFDKFQVIEVEISISDEDWADMLENPLEEEYKQCDVTVNGTVYSDAAIRTKGNTSLSQVASSESDRYSFKIEFDHYDKNKSMDGLDKLVLNNLFCDAAYVKEYIAYDIFNYLGVETPYYAFANITVNGENFGCYLALEAMEDSFLTRVYNGEGQLYKPESTQAGGGGHSGGRSDKMEPPEGAEGFGGGEGSEGGEMSELPEGAEGFGNGQGSEGGEMSELPEGAEDFGNGQGSEGGGMPELPEGAEGFGNGQGSEGSGMPELPEGMEDFGKGGFGMNESGGGSDLVYVDDDADSYSDIFDNAAFTITESDEQRVIEALKKLNAGEELEKYVDVDACLRYFAAQTFIVNMDSYYSSLKHNYYLYERDGQLTILPWDLNLAFGGFQSTDATDAVNSAIDTPMGGSLEESRPLFSKLMEVEEYKELYHSYLSEIVEGYVNSGLFTSTLSKIKSVIEPYVDMDTTAFYSYQEFQEAIATLEAFVLLRAESVDKQLKGTIPSVSEERTSDTELVDASSISLSTMGVQGGDGAGGKGSQGGNMFGNGPMGKERGMRKRE